jgi:alpha-mannosidase
VSVAADARAFLAGVVRPAVHPRRLPLAVTARSLPGEPEPPELAVSGPFQPFSVGDRWGGMWGTTWFRFRSSVPDDWAGEPVVALVHLGGARQVGFSAEGLVYTADLVPVQGLHHEHREYPLGDGPGPVDFYVEAAANPIPRWHTKDWPRLEPDYCGPPLYALEQAELAVVDLEVAAFEVELDLAVQMAEWLEGRRDEAENALRGAMSAVAAGGPGAAARARSVLAPLFYRSASEAGHTITAVGHAHIDTAWLWPVRETRRKCARTFANQLRLIERYPQHRFVCSQAVQYQWVKEDHPGLYAQIAEAVAAGRWEPVGGMWVEPDTNLPSGESLVRQLVHGKRFFSREFGVETRELWIPDVFGYSAALPQIARQAGVDTLITQKMSWNDTNPFPHSTFWWEGHDGSRILAHFPPAATYNGSLSVAELLSDVRNFRESGRLGHTLYPFGYGDGGGGPSARQLEAAARLADAGGLPRVEIRPLARFLDDVHSDTDRLATWVGELYLEYHRATPTTHADVKAGNRRGEEALRAAELWAVAAGLDAVNESLEPLWQRLLLNQFHDILPGSSIGWVYRDTSADHAAVQEGAAAVAEEAMARLAGSGSGAVVFNPSSWDRCELVATPDGWVPVSVPGCGWAPLPEGGGVAPAGGGGVAPAGGGGAGGRAAGGGSGWPPVTAGDGWVDNGLLRVAWDGTGALVSVFDHEECREVLVPGEAANRFQIHEDHPAAFDAWDVDRSYLDAMSELPARVLEPALDGPWRAGVRTRGEFGSSWLEQEMWLSAGSRRIEFQTVVEWQERHRFLKVAFPVSVRTTRATFEIQHGHIERPTHANTSWDEARFEVWAHRWADLSEEGYGVALLNDAKYGYDVRGHTLRLSLLRGPGYPDPDADRGRHRFRYALLPHPGGPVAGRVAEEAEAFNLPLVVRAGSSPRAGRVVEVDRPGVSIEALKPADDGDGVILRICEVHGRRRPARVRLNLPLRPVERTDLLERPAGPVDTDGGAALVGLRPFELVTLRFRA